MAERTVQQKEKPAAVPATVEAPVKMLPAHGIKLKKRVTIPTLKFPDESEIVFIAGSPIRQGKEIKEGRGGKPKMAPAMVMEIGSPTGEVMMLVCGTILQNELESAYPNHSYVGKWFYVKKHAKAPGKDYNTYTIQEIENPTK